MEKSFNFKESYYNVMKMLEPSAQASLIMGINSYYFDGVEPNFSDIVLKASWVLIKPQLETSEKKVGRPRKESVEPIHIEVGKVEDKIDEPIVVGEPVEEFQMMLNTPQVEEKPMDNSFAFGSGYSVPEEKPKKGRKPKVKEPKHQYGSCSNVELTDAEIERLNNEYSKAKTDKAIEYLSTYKKEKGYVTHDDNLTLRRWVFSAIEKQNNSYGTWNPTNNKIRLETCKTEEDLKAYYKQDEQDPELIAIRERNRRDSEERDRRRKEEEEKKKAEQEKLNNEIF